MTFTNVEIDLETLPRSADVSYHELHPRYARVVLGLALALWTPILLVALAWFLGAALSGAIPPLAAILPLAAAALLFGFFVWFAHRSARVMRYALRQHDVIVQSGVFWKKETVQPIRRIQHIEQHQGPVDKRFGLYELKLFSAGTAYLTFRIPGLDADTASRIRQFILNVQEDDWGAEEPDEPVAARARAESATDPEAGEATRGSEPTPVLSASHNDEAREPAAAARTDTDG